MSCTNNKLHQTILLSLETGCYDINGNKVSRGRYFIPQKDACLQCKCSDGEPEACVLTKCAKPTCTDYKSIPGKCCAYTCPSGELAHLNWSLLV